MQLLAVIIAPMMRAIFVPVTISSSVPRTCREGIIGAHSSSGGMDKMNLLFVAPLSFAEDISEKLSGRWDLRKSL